MLLLKYMEADSQQTLREGIIELRKAEMENDEAEQVSLDLSDDIDEHDAIHVLFACRTDLKGEILAHVWSLFGTTMKMHQMRRVNAHDDHKRALRQIGHLKLLITWGRNLPMIVTTIIRAKRMHKKFPVGKYTRYLEYPMCDIRAEFGIQLS